MIDRQHIQNIVDGKDRLTAQQALDLYNHASLHDLGRWSSQMCNRIHGDTYRTYIIDRNINYTNVCSARCTFCAFRRDVDDHDAYTLGKDELRDKLTELVNLGGTQALLQGGMHPDLPISFYEQLLVWLKSKFPSIHMHAFSPPEFVEFVAIFDVPGFPKTLPGKSHELPGEVWSAKLDVIIERLQKAGLDSIPGGGGEIFASPVRDRIGRGKASASQWLDVMRSAHRHGMNTSATMMFGHIESIADRVDHMDQVRKAQDQAIENNWPGKYTAFISWPFQRENTPMGRLPNWDRENGKPFPGEDIDHPEYAKVPRMSGATDYLRMQAISRLYLDNIHSIGASWVTMGPHIGQLGLFYGANDMGSVMIEENVVSAAGTTYCLDEALLCRLIRNSGFTPAQRANDYSLLTVHDGENSPDLAVTDWSKHRVEQLHQHGEEAPESLTQLTIGSPDNQ
ncbi:MAG: radical SAM protein [Phycisphaeraceae bacterium]|nr:radical SAM protein [Phycisphaeraceae bacterium]